MEIARRAKMAGVKVARRIASKSLILMYHRVFSPDIDPWALCVTPEYFAEQLQVLKDTFNVVTLRDLGRALSKGRIADRTIAISFDDGYADVFHNARPALDAFDMPATVFATTGNLARDREFWWDELEQFILNDRPLPEKLTLTINGSERSWAVSSDSSRGNMKSRRAWEGEPGSRMSLFHEIWESMLRLSSEEQNSVLDQLAISLESPPTLRPSYRSMTADQVFALAKDGLIDVGSHTVNHPLLTAHSELVQRQEIENNKSQLEEIIGSKVSCFAYPFGDHNSETASITREAGFECACTTVENTVWRFSDPFRMPRLAVENCNGDEFAKRLHALLD